MKSQNIIVILPNGVAVGLTAKDPVTLEELQFMVGGDIETVATHLPEIGTKRIKMIINKEGKLKGLPRNQAATVLADIMPTDHIVGRAVLCKEDGEEPRPFTDEETEAIQQQLKSTGVTI